MNEPNQNVVILKVDGEKIPLNHFVETVFVHVIRGLVDSLDKIPPQPRKIEIIIDRS